MKRRSFLGGALGATAGLTLAACGGDPATTPGGGSSGGGTTEIVYWLWQDDATDPTWTNLAKGSTRLRPTSRSRSRPSRSTSTRTSSPPRR